MYHHAVGAAVGHHIVKDFELFVGKVLGVQGSSDPDTDCLGRNLFQQRVPVVQVTSWDSLLQVAKVDVSEGKGDIAGISISNTNHNRPIHLSVLIPEIQN